MTPISHSRKLNRSRTIALLESLQDAGEPAKTLYQPAGSSETDIKKSLLSVVDNEHIRSEIAQAVSKSKTGSVLFWGESHHLLILPPFPLIENITIESYHTAPLLSQIREDRIIGLVLVRLGESAVGIFKGESRISSKVGTGLVHARHRQGGSSSQRFERHRQKQMEMFFERVCNHAREHFEPHTKQIDYVVYGGERKTLQLFRKQCRFLQLFDDRVLSRTLDVRKPRQATLEEAITEVWSSTLIEWNPCTG